MILLTANSFVFDFRGTELNPSDIFSIKTAVNVASEYKFVWSAPLIYSWICFVIILISSRCLPKFNTARYTRLVTLAMSLIFFGIVVIGIRPIKEENWAKDGTRYNGYLLNYACLLRSSYITPPDNYSQNTLAEIEKTFTNNSSDTSSHSPTVIVIMNESLADLNVIGSLNTNKEVLPYLSSLTNNTIKGSALSSVYGGGTSNSEFEFLTGNSMAFLPDGTNAYQQYVRNNQYSLVSEFSNNGYKCIAMHPYYSNGWRRNIVYPMLGFDECYFIEDFNQSNKIRNYISDQEMYDTLIFQETIGAGANEKAVLTYIILPFRLTQFRLHQVAARRPAKAVAQFSFLLKNRQLR